MDAIPYAVGSKEYFDVVLQAVNDVRISNGAKPLEAVRNGARGGSYYSCAVGVCFNDVADKEVGRRLASYWTNASPVLHQYEVDFEYNLLPSIGRGSAGFRPRLVISA